MTEIESKILEQLRKGPKSFKELFDVLVWESSTIALDNALDALLDAKKVVFLVAVGLYALGVDA